MARRGRVPADEEDAHLSLVRFATPAAAYLEPQEPGCRCRYRDRYQLRKRARERPSDPIRARLAQMAKDRLVRFRCAQPAPPPPPRTMDHGKQLELLCKHAGMAEAYQWVHLSVLR